MSDENYDHPEPALPARIEPEKFQALMDMGNDKALRNKFLTNFRNDGPQAAAFITQALAMPGVRIDEVGNEPFPTKYYLAHVAEFVADDGEVIPMPRVILIGPNGETMPFVSEGGIRSLDLIRTLCGEGPWDPPLPISVVSVRTRRGFKTYRLVLGSIQHGKVERTVSGGGRKRERQGSADETRDVDGGQASA